MKNILFINHVCGRIPAPISWHKLVDGIEGNIQKCWKFDLEPLKPYDASTARSRVHAELFFPMFSIPNSLQKRISCVAAPYWDLSFRQSFKITER